MKRPHFSRNWPVYLALLVLFSILVYLLAGSWQRSRQLDHALEEVQSPDVQTPKK